MLKIGITGGIGSGKTFVSKLFHMIGIPVYNSDLRARELMEHDQDLMEAIIKQFGPESYSGSKLNRSYLAQIVFTNPDRLKQLNILVHPAVRKEFNTWSELQKSPYVMQESAIIFENGIDQFLDKVIAIDAPDDIRIRRIMKRDGMTKDEVENRMKNQWPAKKIRQLADYIINNNGIELILPQIIKTHNKLIAWQYSED